MEALQESARPVSPRRAFALRSRFVSAARKTTTFRPTSARPKRARSSRSPSDDRLPAARAAEPSFAIVRESHEPRTGLAAFSAARRRIRVRLRLSRDEPAPRHRGAARAKAPAKPAGRKPPAHPVASGPIRMLTFGKFSLSNLRKDPHVRGCRAPFRCLPKPWARTSSQPCSGTSPRRRHYAPPHQALSH